MNHITPPYRAGLSILLGDTAVIIQEFASIATLRRVGHAKAQSAPSKVEKANADFWDYPTNVTTKDCDSYTDLNIDAKEEWKQIVVYPNISLGRRPTVGGWKLRDVMAACGFRSLVCHILVVATSNWRHF